MNIYCINLDARIDRWDAVRAQFDNIPEINLVKISAVEHKFGWYHI